MSGGPKQELAEARERNRLLAREVERLQRKLEHARDALVTIRKYARFSSTVFAQKIYKVASDGLLNGAGNGQQSPD